MRCHEINELLSAYFDGLLDPSVQNTVDLHLEGCTACRTEFEDLAMVVGLVRNLAPLEPPVQFGKELRSKLENLKSPGGSPGILKKLVSGRWSTVVALAASFLLVFGIAGAWPDLTPWLGVSKQEAGVQTQVAGRAPADAPAYLDKSIPEAQDESINREKTLSVNNVVPAGKSKEAVQEDRIAAKLPAAVPSRLGQSQNPEITSAPPRTVDSGGGVAARGVFPGGHLLMDAPAGPAVRASLDIKADDIGAAMRQISDVARIHGGLVELPQEMGVREMTVTIPDSQFDKVMAEIGKTGKVTINNSPAPEDADIGAAAAPTVTGVYFRDGAEPGMTSLQVPEADSGKQPVDKKVQEDSLTPAGEPGVSLIRIRFE